MEYEIKKNIHHIPNHSGEIIPFCIKVRIAYSVNTAIVYKNRVVKRMRFFTKNIKVRTSANALPTVPRTPKERANSVADPAYIIMQKK
jgi:hypothetical protein